MPQLHFYVSEDVASDLRRRAKASGLSVSQYIASVVRREVHPGWPKGFFSEVVGGWSGPRLKRDPQPRFEERDDL